MDETHKVFFGNLHVVYTGCPPFWTMINMPNLRYFSDLFLNRLLHVPTTSKLATILLKKKKEEKKTSSLL